MRIYIIALFTILIQGAFTFLGFLVGLACVGLYLGYVRAWEIGMPVSLPTRTEDDED